MRFLVLLFPLLAAPACKAPSPSSSVAALEGKNAVGNMSIVITANSTTMFVPNNANDRITKVSSVPATLTLNSQPVAASKTPVVIGSIGLGKVTYEINGDTPCSRNMQTETQPKCTPPAGSIDSTSAEPASNAPAPQANQVATPIDGMTCAAHSSYPTKIWQKQFRVALAGATSELDKIQEVRYTVHSAYGKTFVGSSRSKNFDAESVFLTPVASWSIDQAVGVDKSGKEFPIGRATISWTDNDPEKRAATACVPPTVSTAD